MTADIERRVTDPFEPALAGTLVRLVCSDGREFEQPVDRWHAPADIDDEWLLQRCCGPTVDMGCGPGRLLAALTERGVPALGVDRSPRAVRQSHTRGGPALHRDVFDPLPGEGKWSHVLLADGNIGIGGDPAALLHRCADLIHPGGTVLVEAEAPGTGLWRGNAQLHASSGPGGAVGPSFPWALVRLDTLAGLAGPSVLQPADSHRSERYFIELRRPHS